MTALPTEHFTKSGRESGPANVGEQALLGQILDVLHVLLSSSLPHSSLEMEMKLRAENCYRLARKRRTTSIIF
jgi:hypothetical protein